MIDIHQDMKEYPPSIAGAKNLGDLADGFAFYEFEWMGDNPKEFNVMKITGCVFRAALSGPRKGQRVIEVKGTRRTVYVTKDEIRAVTDQSKKQGDQS